MSKFIQLTPFDIVEYWGIISYAYSETSMLSKPENINMMLQHTLLDLLAGQKICFAVFDDESNIKIIAGIKIMSSDMNIESVRSIIVGPVYGFEALTQEERTELFNKVMLYKENIKADHMYFYSNVPIAWNVAEKLGMKFMAKVYRD